MKKRVDFNIEIARGRKISCVQKHLHYNNLTPEERQGLLKQQELDNKKNNKNQNECLNLKYHLDKMELDIRNGFKSYEYMPLSDETMKWLKENYPMEVDANFIGPPSYKGTVQGSKIKTVTINGKEYTLNFGPKVNSAEFKVPGSEGTGKNSVLQEVFDIADDYKLSDDVFENHILDRHGSKSLYGNKSHFNSNFDIRDGIDSTLKGENFIVKSNTGGRDGYIFEQTFTDPIGVNTKGKSLYTIKVVIDADGNVITAFPKK